MKAVLLPIVSPITCVDDVRWPKNLVVIISFYLVISNSATLTMQMNSTSLCLTLWGCRYRSASSTWGNVIVISFNYTAFCSVFRKQSWSHSCFILVSKTLIGMLPLYNTSEDSLTRELIFVAE